MALRGGASGLSAWRGRVGCAGVVVACVACTGASRHGDTTAVQTLGRWEWHGRLVMTEDSSLTLERLDVDTSARGGDVVLVRYEFGPAAGLSANYALTLGLGLGTVRALEPGVRYPFGPGAGGIPAYATLACLCPPMRSDSVRGTFLLVTRGLRQLTGRIDAVVYLSEWNAATHHTTYAIHQRFDAIK
jgi:hypothetical protein